MQQVDQHVEVYTTIFTPQVCRRTRRHEGTDKVVTVVWYQSRGPKELDLDQGDQVQVLFKEDEAWWVGRLTDGSKGYFPAACVEPIKGLDSPKATPTLTRRCSVPAVVTPAGSPCGCTRGRSTPKLLRKHSVQRPKELNGPSAAMGSAAAAPPSSTSLLLQVLAKSRRKSCPHLRHPPLDAGTVNSAFQPD